MRKMIEPTPKELKTIIQMRNKSKPWHVIAEHVGRSTFYVRRVYIRETDPKLYSDTYLRDLKGGRPKTLNKYEMAEQDYRDAAKWRPAFKAVNALQRFMEMTA